MMKHRHICNMWTHPLAWLRANGMERRRGGHRGGGDGEMTRGRKFGAEDLQLLLLALISERPAHGYELIKELAARSNGYYSPSPGMVYPALTYLEELSQVTVEAHGNRKSYSLAPEGMSRLDSQREHVDLMLAKLRHVGRKMELARRAYAGEEIGEQGAAGWTKEMIEARRALKHALLLRDDADEAEQQRIAAILRRATAEIIGEAMPGC
ncbi:PadR family transcriptional regulator [Chromobacterium sp. IIBBL 290-4]|uniref:PadR family transcriptional regulator n=1 Tax=Chromobacterium sp. IIBBL 290-4 TaxID=2953890 RepID=UPI0020B69222|nr:PadR family transcriptional regulator [Chromobacterium sp. IIBBL 290-4]UTH73785.1 PadR family transcriptional regulator [Chromobacterium sp. IIBBL 290-4]